MIESQSYHLSVSTRGDRSGKSHSLFTNYQLPITFHQLPVSPSDNCLSEKRLNDFGGAKIEILLNLGGSVHSWTLSVVDQPIFQPVAGAGHCVPALASTQYRWPGVSCNHKSRKKS